MIGNQHWGSSLDNFLKQEGTYDELQAVAAKEAIALQFSEAMKEMNISRKRMAELMHTSQTQVDKLLDPRDGNVTIETLRKAAAVVGKRFEFRLV